TILFYRELDFSLKDIAKIISSPNFNKIEALSGQKKLLMLKKERIERLINAIDDTLKGEKTMNLNEFDNSEFENQKEKYAEEVRQRWGDTSAYSENAAKTSGYSAEKWREFNAEMDEILGEFGACLKSGSLPESDTAQKLVQKLQLHISENHYTCTEEILAGLGQMYVCDERFKANIDKNGAGTADFLSKSIAKYCE
ncbi:MAG: TipAS antibiotic-recognition domain-containing protein, partial [Oscillospiraceae bacterium]